MANFRAAARHRVKTTSAYFNFCQIFAAPQLDQFIGNVTPNYNGIDVIAIQLFLELQNPAFPQYGETESKKSPGLVKILWRAAAKVRRRTPGFLSQKRAYQDGKLELYAEPAYTFVRFRNNW